VVKGQEANTVTVVNAVKELMTEFESEVDGLVIDITLDQGDPIEESVFAMIEKALIGGLIAVAIILIFLRDFRSTLIAIVSIPVSIFVALLETPIPTAMGTTMTIGELVEVEEGTTQNTLSRSEGEYYASVSGTIAGNDVSGPSADAQEAINTLDLPMGVKVETGGVTADINETFTQLGIAMAAAIAIVYFILVVTFGGGLAPFAILFSLPFAVIGSFTGLLIAGQTISVSVMMGLLMLIGIVVTNAIVLVDRVIQMEREGLSVRDALLEAGATRLRPILMTAIATIGAMVPMALSSGGGGLVSQDLAITVIGGLFSSTLLTLIVVPVVYEVLRKFQKNKSLIDTEE